MLSFICYAQNITNITIQQPFNETGNSLDDFIKSIQAIPFQRLLVGSVGFAYYIAQIVGKGFTSLALIFNIPENYAIVMGGVGAFIMVVLLIMSLAVAIARIVKKSIKYALLIAIVIILASIAFGIAFGG